MVCSRFLGVRSSFFWSTPVFRASHENDEAGEQILVIREPAKPQHVARVHIEKKCRSVLFGFLSRVTQTSAK